ncbi:EscV/YscV/HrcV family type III secretion system export apparatus protein [Phyllobacterium phragmitis]|uniref:EscV/YscV/HrcV family type III secretion system export apparatus protein n=1 Tax=Phyllobacterium phragmitis TaxID=2670329 RepID=A0A2S9IMK4_9HYPH|nr:type III secretion system export apparatus subunit SctV [Phyllobacterium phragmitis]PRD41745.1 EscV/YscV/HrcV family type III secretion system export apparatus protein [Phyllobacterium phragmitis]
MTGILGTLNSFARAAAHRSDIVVASFMMLAVVMMVIPLPTLLVDVLIAVNMAFSLLILVVAFYIGRPGDFSSLPPIILIATLFRLALSITTTRLILLHADAGDIVATFGRFVIGGEVAVGLVVFLIITAAQFIVITKGAERVAEVAARFTLDAMPGKQMSIDNDLRSGDINQIEARARRGRLERESQLYGAMDGAMKFVKGDAITGLIIVFVNLIGGLLIGMLNRNMSFAGASQTYSLLTVGDGLIAQIPALLISIAAGMVVTRVASETESDLGTEIFRQLGSSDRALALAAVILLGAGFVPGFPTLIFVGLAALFGGLAFMIYRRRPKPETLPAIRPERETVEVEETPHSESAIISGGSTRHRVVAHVGSNISQAVWPERFRTETDLVRDALRLDLGLEVPAVELRPDQTLMPDRFRVDLEGVPIVEGEIPRDSLLLNDDPMHLDLLQMPRRDGPALFGGHRTIWIDQEHANALADAGIGFHDPAATLAKCLSQALRRYAAHFIGIQETRELLTQMEGEYSELVKEASRVVPLNKLSDILRRLVEEDIPIGNLRVILEALVEWGGREADTLLLTERVRIALARQICHRHAQLNRVLAAYVLSRAAEEGIRNAIKVTGVGKMLALPEDASRAMLSQLRQELADSDERQGAVLLTSVDLRRVMRNYLLRNDIELPVLSYQEIAPEYSVQSLTSVTIDSRNRNRLTKSTANEDMDRQESIAVTVG